MKKIIVLALICICTSGLYAQTCSPAGNSQFDMQKSASRIGLFTAPNDSPDSIGCYAAAFGYQTKPKGYASFSIGNSTSTTGDYSFSAGSNSIASGQNAMATGSGTLASGLNSFTSGANTISSGDNSFASGSYSKATGANSFASGYGAWASGDHSFALGNNAKASGYYSFASGPFSTAPSGGSIAIGFASNAAGGYSATLGYFSSTLANMSVSAGYFTKAQSFAGMSVGHFNDSAYAGSTNSITAANRIFQIGNGTADNARSNAMTVLQNGNVGVGVLNPTTKLHVKGEVGFWSSNKTWTVGYDSTNHYFFIDEYGNGKKLFIKDGGNVGIGIPAPAQKLEVSGNIKSTADIYANNNMQVDMGNINAGSLENALRFGPLVSGEGIGSRRTGNGNGYGIDFYTNNQNRMTITNNGNVGINLADQSITEKLQVSGNAKVSGNVIVQSNKGIIRSNDATQQKKLVATYYINSYSFLAGETRTFTITWPENFGAAPDAFVGNIVSGTGGWAEVVMSLTNVTTTGATLYVYNPKNTPVTPNFTVKIIAIGAQ